MKRPPKVLGISRHHTVSEHYAVVGQPIVRPSDLDPVARSFWIVVVPHLEYMALADRADEPELKAMAKAYSDAVSTGSSRASLEFSRLLPGFCLEAATKDGPLSKFWIQVRTNPAHPEYYSPKFEEI
jgi:phage terminase small subunit